jgi:tetrahydromethanopterin S-methyltransferase subunit C
MSEMKKVTIDPNKLMMAGLLCGLAGSYIGVAKTEVAGLLAGILAIPAIIWGADAVRRIASYGLGTGVPSIGNLSSSMGLLAALVGLVYQPALGALLAAIAGLVYGNFVAKFRILEIPRLPRYTMELATAACLAITCLVSCAVGGYDPLAPQSSFEYVVRALLLTGFIAPIYWLTSVAMFHPFNAGLGAGERQGRTLTIGVVTSGIALTLTGIVRAGYLAISASQPTMLAAQSFMPLTYAMAYCTIGVGALVWVTGLIALLSTARREAAIATWTGIPPKPKK